MHDTQWKKSYLKNTQIKQLQTIHVSLNLITDLDIDLASIFSNQQNKDNLSNLKLSKV